MKIPIYIEDKKFFMKESTNILEACLSLGFNIPYFCWHPALGSVGSCRQCAVKCRYNNTNNSNQQCSKLVMACLTPVEKNICIYIFDKEVMQFRKGIIELLMIDHPHDCPVCEEGGNCHLQDMTVMTGHTYRRYRFTKRTHYNQYLGPFIAHEMNRCITCYRCIRYYKDYAGGKDLGVFGIHDNIYFGRVHDGMLQSEFSGNLIEICPTGVFTDKTRSANYARKWDTIFAPSICQQCSVGCNIILGERYGKLSRVENRYNSVVNGYFLCDRGRFGCDYIDLDNRLKKPLKRKNNDFVEIDINHAIQVAVDALKNSNKIIGIGSSRASIESNFALRKLVGSDNFFIGIHQSEQQRLSLILEILRNKGVYVPTVHEIESYDAILILGEDLTQTSARIALSVRQAVQKKAYTMAESQGIFDWQFEAVFNIAQDIKYPLFITSLDKTKLDDLAVLTYYDSVQNQARFGFAIAHALDNEAPVVEDFDDDELNKKVNMIAKHLIKAHKPLIISGTNSGSMALIESAFNIVQALKNRGSDVGITLVVNDVNSIGLTMIENKSLDEALFLLCDDQISSSSLIILENDLYNYANSTLIHKALKKVNYVIVLDHQKSLIQDQADLILSSTSFAESNGTVINYEGRAQRFFKLYDPQSYNKDVIILESWRWLYLIHDVYVGNVRKKHLNIDYVINSVISQFPHLKGIKKSAPGASFRIHGQKMAQAPHRYSGRTAIHSHTEIHEPCIVPNTETMFTCSMEGYHSDRSLHKQVAFAWSPGWNSPQSWNKFQKSIGKSLYPEDPGVCLLGKKQIKNSDYNNKVRWFTKIPYSSIKKDNLNFWLIAPYWHLFGSEYTSQQSKYIKKSMLKVYAMLNPLDAVKLNIKEDMFLSFRCADRILCLPVKLSVNLPILHIGLPMGFPGIPIFFSDMHAQCVKGVSCHDN